MSKVHDAFVAEALQYAALGWKIVPLRPATKKPFMREWQFIASDDEDQIIEWFERWPNMNIGVQLGQRSGIIDIEGDHESFEAELSHLFGGDVPMCPTFTSMRGKHRFFKWRDDLPGGGTVDIGHLGCKFGNQSLGSQSVVPPSIHPVSGEPYRWLPGLSYDEVSPAEIPDSVVDKFWLLAGEKTIIPQSKSGAKKAIEAEEHPEGERNASMFLVACTWVKDVKDLTNEEELNSFYEKLSARNQEKCKPPMREHEIRTIHAQALRYEKVGREKEKELTKNAPGKNSIELYKNFGLDYVAGQWYPGRWKLTLVKSDPIEYRLNCPLWKRYTRNGSGDVIIPAANWDDAHAVMRAVKEATLGNVSLNVTARMWPNIWNGTLGSKKDKKPPTVALHYLLTQDMIVYDPPVEQKRYLVVAEMLHEILGRTRKADEDGIPSPVCPTMMEDGNIWMRWRPAWNPHVTSLHEVTWEEVNALANEIGLKKTDSIRWPNHPREGETRHRYAIITPEHCENIQRIIDTG